LDVQNSYRNTRLTSRGYMSSHSVSYVISHQQKVRSHSNSPVTSFETVAFGRLRSSEPPPPPIGPSLSDMISRVYLHVGLYGSFYGLACVVLQYCFIRYGGNRIEDKTDGLLQLGSSEVLLLFSDRPLNSQLASRQPRART
jgi:hypothetical protein